MEYYKGCVFPNLITIYIGVYGFGGIA
jgi:hypothetical protein